MLFIGELIALTTVLCWTVSVQFFAAATKQVGATSVNTIRIAIALLLFTGYMLVLHGHPIPLEFPARSWILLSLSGVIGFFLGDICLFKALAEMGPRITLLIFSLAAPLAALIGWSFLGETYAPVQWTGMFVTLFGVGIVILEKNKGGAAAVSLKGLGLGIGAMIGQAVGYVLSKSGMQSGAVFLDPFAATQIRALAAFACFIIYFTLTGKWGRVARAMRNTKALGQTAAGAVIGPFIGVSLSLKTLHYLSTGVASTFLSLTPVAIIPFSIFLHKEHVSARAMAGAVIAVSGIYLLMGT